MKSKKPMAVLLSACMSSAAVYVATADGATAPVKVVVSAAHSYDVTGPVKFETLFAQMAGFNSPTVAGTAPDGAFTFLPKSATSPGGSIQIKFVSLQARFKAECEVGNSGQQFEVVLSDTSGGGVQTLNASSQRAGSNNLLIFESKPMRGSGDFVIRIASPSAQRDWNLSRCDITVEAAAAAPSAPTLRVD